MLFDVEIHLVIQCSAGTTEEAIHPLFSEYSVKRPDTDQPKGVSLGRGYVCVRPMENKGCVLETFLTTIIIPAIPFVAASGVDIIHLKG